MTNDPFRTYKAGQREAWASFAPLATFTTPPAAHLVDFAGIKAGEQVLDVACGTGVAAITAAVRGAHASGLDLSPVLIDEARKSAALGALDVDFVEGDAEALPHPDAHFDVVISQFGHMFAPRPSVVTGEMLRVLKPGGRIAFATWPPELMIGAMFTLTAGYLDAPEGVVPPPQWGVPGIVRERLGNAVRDLQFQYDDMRIPSLSPRHYRANMERTAAPVVKVVERLADDAAQLATFRTALEALVSRFFDRNWVRQTFLLSRAVKV
jgi:SAM-dependent methyltransferase